ncbi:CubicO group peptidase, beta-lactamase class C family [Tenacibaculum sp. MAR_2010_89]|uniref:serine hydrolase domain-containing protein n=1 Tax=Tenacibaculum sp. MAR_2010_89 TaxID=1250198 RepID=UPI00089C8EC2|nr:serine hydrolase domain-containing protein [Tenacibaculum sp. MAR_2010_89]SEE17467.1 CubicO group peptidase, beta-lactamase class C family [Tenacibaculum sp. MAR_2010_89]
MKFHRSIFIFLFSITSTIIYAQSLQLQLDKYTPYIKELNQGVAVLVQQNGKTTVANAGKYNFNNHTIFNIGSATKKMTAILLLQEVEKGTIKLSDSIGTYLQPIKNVDGSLTIETLLRHRSGLGEIVGKNFEKDFYAKNDSFYNSNFLNKIPKNNPKKIGKYDYCNTNYILLGHLLEKVNDKSYFNLLQERIFTPCNMTNTYPYVSKKLKNLAKPIHKKEDITSYLDYRFFANYAYAAGSVASNLNDMSKFYNHLFQKGTLISEKSLQKFTAFDEANYGLGIMKFKDGYVGHGGNNIGYSFREYYNPKNKNLILLFSNARIIPFNRMLKNELFNFIDGKTDTISFNKNVTSDFKNVLGKYLFNSHGMKMTMEIKEENNHLYFLAQGAQVILISKEKNKLYNGSFGVELEVNPEKPQELIFRQNGLETTIKLIKS